MFLITNLRRNRQIRKMEATNKLALVIKAAEQQAVYRYMDELSEKGYDFINPPKAS